MKLFKLEGGFEFGSRNYTTVSFLLGIILSLGFVLSSLLEGQFSILAAVGAVIFIVLGTQSLRHKKRKTNGDRPNGATGKGERL